MPTGPARRTPAAVVLLALLTLVACGSQAPLEKTDATAKPDGDTLACRHQWRDLGEKVKASAERTNPSALAERWNAVVATIDYYAASATKDDCGDRLTAQQSANKALTAFESRLRPYDVPYRYAQVRSAAQQYAARPAPKLTKKPAGPKAKKSPPAPKEVAAAMKVLDAQAATATTQQGPAWEQAGVVELGDSAATAKAVKDLRFLSSESAAYRACSSALGTINSALATTR